MRIHINLDPELVSQIDDLAGARGRSAFIRGAVASEAEKQRKLAILRATCGTDPRFMNHLPDDWVRRERRAATEASDGRLREAPARYDGSDRDRSGK